MQLLKQLFEGAGLPADFETKAQVVFDAAIGEAVAIAVEAETVKLAESMEVKLNEAKEAFIAEQTTALEAFIDHTVAEWATENAIAVDGQLKSEIAEQFLGGLSKLFKENSVKLLPDATGVVEGLQKEVADLQAKLVESKTVIAESLKQVNVFEKVGVLSELTEGLADTQVERITRLAEQFDFTDKESFKTKVSFVVEAVTGKLPAPKEGEKPTAPGKEGEDDAKKKLEEAAAAKALEEAEALKTGNPADTKIIENHVVENDLVAQTLLLMSGGKK